jgi:hypothetical protein
MQPILEAADTHCSDERRQDSKGPRVVAGGGGEAKIDCKFTPDPFPVLSPTITTCKINKFVLSTSPFGRLTGQVHCDSWQVVPVNTRP